MPPLSVAAGHVSPGHACRHEEVVLFDQKKNRSWFFFTTSQDKGSYLSKNLNMVTVDYLEAIAGAITQLSGAQILWSRTSQPSRSNKLD
jgi:hypothetical protein